MMKVENLSKSYGGLVVTDGVSFQVGEGKLLAIIGPNGAGKTTLIAQLAGEVRPDQGSVWFAGRNVTRLSVPMRARLGLARTYQITSVFPDFTVRDNVALALQAHRGHSFDFFGTVAADAGLAEPAMRALTAVGLDAKSGVPAAVLSHGEKRALELAMALAVEPKLLLLDEPLAGMGPEDSEQMVARLKALKGRFTIILVEHDMGAVFALADQVAVLVRGRLVADGAPAGIRNDPVVRAAYLGDEGGA